MTSAMINRGGPAKWIEPRWDAFVQGQVQGYRQVWGSEWLLLRWATKKASFHLRQGGNRNILRRGRK